jgi:hypothetical protein
MLCKFNLHEEVTDDRRFLRFRSMIDRAQLAEKMGVLCNSINEQAFAGLIYEEVFTAPSPIVRRYVYAKDNIEYSLTLAILYDGPGVIFSSSKPNDWTSRLRRYWGLYSLGRNNVAFKLVINPATVNTAELQQWFTYLLSGLRFSFRPHRRMSILATN